MAKISQAVFPQPDRSRRRKMSTKTVITARTRRSRGRRRPSSTSGRETGNPPPAPTPPYVVCTGADRTTLRRRPERAKTLQCGVGFDGPRDVIRHGARSAIRRSGSACLHPMPASRPGQREGLVSPTCTRTPPRRQSSGESSANAVARARSFAPVRRRPGDDDSSAGTQNLSTNCEATSRDRISTSILQEPLELRLVADDADKHGVPLLAREVHALERRPDAVAQLSCHDQPVLPTRHASQLAPERPPPDRPIWTITWVNRFRRAGRACRARDGVRT
jgi:hypothetical protein